MFGITALILLALLAISIFLGKFFLPEKEGEEAEVLRNFRMASRAEIDRMICPEPFYGYGPVSRGKNHHPSRAV